LLAWRDDRLASAFLWGGEGAFFGGIVTADLGLLMNRLLAELCEVRDFSVAEFLE